ncbi:MAG: hypothetical protein ABIG20_00080 [archaeon]
MSVKINGLKSLLEDSRLIKRICKDSPDGKIWAYAVSGPMFTMDLVELVINEFNENGKDAFKSSGVCSGPFFWAGPTFDSVVHKQSEGVVVEINPETKRILSVYYSRDGEKELICMDNKTEYKKNERYFTKHKEEWGKQYPRKYVVVAEEELKGVADEFEQAHSIFEKLLEKGIRGIIVWMVGGRKAKPKK